MKLILLSLTLLPLAALDLRATTANEHVCGRGHAWLAPGDGADRRKYAPVREADLLHLAVDVTPDFKERSVAVTAALRFKPIGQPLAELKLDGVDLRVSAVSATEKVLGWQATEDQVIVNFDPPVPAGREATVTIRYSAVPQRGLYFRTPEMGYKPEDTHLWTQGEPNEARHWFPCFDEPNDKFTSEVTCRVPEGMVVLSNGKRMSEERDAGSGLVAVRWLQDKPHVAYLIALCAGKFKKVEDTYRDIPMAFWVPASQIDQAMNSFKDTKDMMAFFEKEIGVPYPWAKYDQVCVNDFGWGGMENTTLTVLNDSTLHTPATENLRDSQGLVAHELAHQWFGDLVTCKDWAHLWLNEGFATYYEALYELHKRGRDHFLLIMHQRARGIAAVANDTNAIVHRAYRQPEEQFGFRAYPKGSWILHMLRSQLGEDLYRQCIKTYLERHQFGLVVTEDLNAVIEELSGRSFDHFFDQYVYHAHHPELNVSYSWDERAKLAKISVAQVQKLSDDVLLFDVPLTVRFKGKSGTVDRELRVKEKAEDFYLPLAEAPEMVRIDPNVALLAKITFTPPTAMIHAQLADQTDAIGRLLAVEHLSGKKDALAKLKETLNNDSFHAVRIEASKAIRAIQTDEAHAALLASTRQSDARVRRQVVADLAGFYRESTREAAGKLVAEEKNPDIQAVAIAALGAYAKPDPRDQLVSLLQSESYRNSLADAAINAMRAQDDARYLPPLLDVLAKKEGAFTTGGFARGLDTVAWLARNEDDKTAAREFLVARLSHPRKRVQQAAINALGTLGDPKAVPALETITSLPKETPERTAAEKAVATLRDTRKPSAELGSLRGEVLTLQKENRDLRRDFDDLKKKFDALNARAAAPAASSETNKNAKAEKPSSAKPKKR